MTKTGTKHDPDAKMVYSSYRVPITCSVMECSVIHRLNTEHYEELLAQTTDEGERQRILKLLEEEREKMLDQPPTRKRT